MRKISYFIIAVVIGFSCGYFAGAVREPVAGFFHDIMVNHPPDYKALVTPRDKRIRILAADLKTPENAFAFVRDRIGDDPSIPALPAGDILEEGRASCLGKAVLLCSLYRAMGIPSASVRVVTGEVAFPGGIADHAWVDMEHNGVCLQQDASNFIGSFSFDQFKGLDYTRNFIRREGYVFNDKSFAVVSQLNQFRGMGHPIPDSGSISGAAPVPD